VLEERVSTTSAHAASASLQLHAALERAMLHSSSPRRHLAGAAWVAAIYFIPQDTNLLLQPFEKLYTWFRHLLDASRNRVFDRPHQGTPAASRNPAHGALQALTVQAGGVGRQAQPPAHRLCRLQVAFDLEPYCTSANWVCLRTIMEACHISALPEHLLGAVLALAKPAG